MAVTIKIRQYLPVLIGVLAMVGSASARSFAQNAEDRKSPSVFRDPDDIPNLIFDTNKDKESRTGRYFPQRRDTQSTDTQRIDSWDSLKASLSQNLGFNFSLAYAYVFQDVNSDGRDVRGSGGQAEFDFTWTAFGRSGTGQKGVFGGKIESQHTVFSANAPQDVAPNAGSIWTAASGYGLIDIAASQLWYEHHLERDRLLVRVGKMSPFTMFDYYRYKSTRSGFLGQIQTFNPAIPFPASTLGVAVGTMLPNGFYAEGGVFDANGTAEKSGFNTLFNRGETFKIADIGWTSDFVLGGDSGSNDIHLTAWHIDRREKAGTPESWGYTVSGQKGFGNVVPFFRYGYASGGATQLEHFVSAGLGIEDVLGYSNDVIAMSVAWGRPSNSQFREQYGAEIFYRMQITPNLALTPDLQLVVNPATNANADYLGITSIRARLAL